VAQLWVVRQHERHEFHEELTKSWSVDLSFVRLIHGRHCSHDFCDWAHQDEFGGRVVRFLCVYHLSISSICAVLRICLSGFQVASKVSFIVCWLVGGFGHRFIFMVGIISTSLMLPNTALEPTAAAPSFYVLLQIHACSCSRRGSALDR
jgi:hypothetical protein